MDKPGFHDGKLYAVNDLAIIHKIIVSVSLVIVTGLCCCQFITFLYQWCIMRRKHVIEMIAQESNTHQTQNQSKMAQKHQTSGDIKSITKNNKYSVMHNFIIITATLASLVTIINGTFYIFNKSIFQFDICGIEQKISLLLYNYAKMCLYYAGILRIFEAFNGSVFEYSKAFRYVLVICVTIMGLIHLTMLSITGDGIKIDTNDGTYWCQYQVTIVGLFLIAILDIGLNIAILILFIKPLFVLIQNTEDIDPDVLNIIIKFSYLVFMAVITTSLYVVMSILGFGTFIAVDCWVNLICLLLMSKTNKKYYHYICNKCHKRLYSIMYHIIDTRKSKNQITSQV